MPPTKNPNYRIHVFISVLLIFSAIQGISLLVGIVIAYLSKKDAMKERTARMVVMRAIADL